MRALVTGGAGFIGSHLVEALCHRGDSVLIFDDFSTGQLENLAWRKRSDSVSFLTGNIATYEDLPSVLDGCDQIFHLAAIASVPASVEDPEKTHAVNLSGTVRLLAAAKTAGVKRFIFASSCSVYSPGGSPLKSESSPEGPVSPYALQKSASEKYCGLYASLHGMETVCLRYFNVYGPRQAFNSPYSGVIARFCTSILNGGNPVIFGDGTQSRDFVYVADVVHANLLASETSAGNVSGKVFNIASGKSLGIKNLLDSLSKILGVTPKPRFEPARPGEIRHIEADIKLAGQSLGYNPTVSIEEGLRNTLEFYKSTSIKSR